MENFEEKIENWLKKLKISNRELKKIMESPNLPNSKIEKQTRISPENYRRMKWPY